MEVNLLALEEQVSTMTTHAWADRSGWENGEKTAKGTEEADLSSADMEAGERICRSRCVRDP